MTEAYFVDRVTGDGYPLNAQRWRSDTGGHLMVSPQNGITRNEVDYAARGIWRYKAALATKMPSPISLGEGSTPLVSTPWLGSEVACKLEMLNPTGSFKDRGASVMLTFLQQQGVTKILEDSSGNGGAAVAAYGAAAGMQVTVYAPESTSDAKLAQAEMYGSKIVRVAGRREDSGTAAMVAHDHGDGYYAGHNWHPMFLEGTKTLAYEIWEDLDFHAPDSVVLPVGAGSTLLGCAIGFDELYRAGQIARVPKLFAVQPLNCSPIDAAYQGVKSRPVAKTVAEGAAISRPVRLIEILRALKVSRGRTVAVSEQDILDSYSLAAQHGLYIEPTSAVAVAGYTSLATDGHIAPDETTVVVLTGSGLKAPLVGPVHLHETD